MASTRKRSSGFSTESSDSQEVLETQTFDEMLESVREVIEAEDQADSPVILPEPFVEQTIVPTADPGPRFLENTLPEKPKEVKPPELKPAPKRRPRNVPKFSRFREV